MEWVCGPHYVKVACSLQPTDIHIQNLDSQHWTKVFFVSISTKFTQFFVYKLWELLTNVMVNIRVTKFCAGKHHPTPHCSTMLHLMYIKSWYLTRLQFYLLWAQMRLVRLEVGWLGFIWNWFISTYVSLTEVFKSFRGFACCFWK